MGDHPGNQQSCRDGEEEGDIVAANAFVNPGGRRIRSFYERNQKHNRQSDDESDDERGSQKGGLASGIGYLTDSGAQGSHCP